MMAGQFHGDETRVIQSVRRSFVSHSSVDVCPRKLDAKIHAKGRTFLMFLRETLLTVSQCSGLVTVTIGLQFPVCGQAGCRAADPR